MAMFVRLKPYNPRAGHVLRRYSYRGIRIEEGKGWHKVPDDVAAYLKEVRQIDGDEHSQLAFEVATKEEAEKINAAEFRKKAMQGALAPNEAPELKARDAGPADPEVGADLSPPNPGAGGDVTTVDLRSGTSRGGSSTAPTRQRSTRG